MIGESYRECTTVVGMRHAFDQSVGFERIDHRHHRVAVDAQSGRELALGLAVLTRQRHQHVFVGLATYYDLYEHWCAILGLTSEGFQLVRRVPVAAG